MDREFWFKRIVLLILLILLPSLTFSNLSKEQARIYRDKGYDAQKNGDYRTAFMFYEKAIALDPSYSIAYNDMGALYERKGDRTNAVAMYLRALQIDPRYYEVYYNLASLYESEGDLLKAASYWMHRVRLGNPHDPGTLRAREHLAQIGQIYPQIADTLREQEMKELFREMEILTRAGGRPYVRKDTTMEIKELLLQMGSAKKFKIKDIKQISRDYLDKGKQAYKAGDYSTAIRNFTDAIYLDPHNKDAQNLLKKSQKKMLLR